MINQNYAQIAGVVAFISKWKYDLEMLGELASFFSHKVKIVKHTPNSEEFLR